MTKIKSASDLKYLHETNDPHSSYFSRDTMKFWGDKMSNYGVRKAKVKAFRGDEVIDAYELHRKKPVKHNLHESTYFDMNGKVIHGAVEV
jgi:hypothetical protein